MDINGLCKIYQLAEILILKYGFQQRLIKKYSNFITSEMWLLNSDDPNYQLIRITTNSVLEFEKDEERVKEYLSQFASASNLSFLDIHISTLKYLEKHEPYPYLNIEDKYAEGVDVSGVYPEVYNVIHESEDPAGDIHEMSVRINEMILKKTGKNNSKTKIPYLTYILMAICIVMYLITFLLERKYSDTAVLTFLGADYMTFTLGLKQFYRLFTTAFLHGSIIHLLTNMYSLFYLGNFIEGLYGRKVFISTLIVSILCGSLTQGILSENTISVGISGGLYGLLVYLIFDLLSRKVIDVRSILPLIIINLFVNFLSFTAWKAHIGGIVAGFAMLYFYHSDKKQTDRYVLVAILLIGLFIRYITIKNISPFYGGTDMETVKIIKDFGFTSYVDNLAKRLLEVYSTYGG